MCGMLDHYLRAFSQLRMEKDLTAWTEATNYRPPGKPFLLLSVLDLIALRSINSNFIEPSTELSDTFQGYMTLIHRRASIAYSFLNLQADGFWELRPRADVEIAAGQASSSIEQLRACYYGAKLAGDLLPLLQMKSSREKLRAVLIETFFGAELQPQLWEQSVPGQAPLNHSVGGSGDF